MEDSRQPRIRLSKRQKRIQRQKISRKDHENSETTPGAIGKCSREGWAVKGEAPKFQRRTIRRRILEEPTGERTEPGENYHGKTEAGDARNPWEKNRPEPTPSQSRPRDEDHWPRGAHV
ncbi:hypothetical protein NDU88_007466 [Pleurodeles waltl]|uniref:Uncharacterized protein n=1 Tax=Pleurodeles waltl TaxID=8319 RepID=A0AAV7RUW3_PLEWA|nr:hypothetical protein NDU88_007466 [Pleurodeles waltl]